MERHLTGPEFCELLRIDANTLGRWIKKDKLKAVRLPGGHLRIPVSEAERFCKERSTGGPQKGELR